MFCRLLSRMLPTLLVATTVCGISWIPGQAADVTMKDGSTFKGSKWAVEATVAGGKAPKIDPDQSPNKCVIMLEEAGAVRVYVPRLQVTTFNKENDLRLGESFSLKPERRARNLRLESVGGKVGETEFDQHGRRRTTYMMPNNKRVDVIQQIFELHPKYVKVTATDYLWEFGLPTNSLTPEILHGLLRKALPQDSADGRFSIVRFCLEGGFFPIAQFELNSISKDFPDRAADVASYSLRLKQYLADEAVRILEERRAAGQYRFSYEVAKQFLALDLPDISGATIQTLQKAVAKHDEEVARMEETRQLIGRLQAELTVEQAAEVALIRRVIGDELNFDTMERLESFLNLSDAENRQPAEKLALAISGWVMGSDQAVTNLPQALRLWQTRTLALNYLRSENSPERTTVIAELERIEGISHQHMLRILALMPPQVETLDIKPSEPFTIEIPAASESAEPQKYMVLLPPEYHHGRNYPLIVALHAAGMNPQTELGWWARQAQRLGYIVIAPTYADEKQRSYNYSPDAHKAVLDSLRDVRRRFTIDSDRIFIGGHGQGGEATFDISMSHPDIFAGAIPICAAFEKFSRVYRDNAQTLPIFLLCGELDRDLLFKNAPDLTKMMELQYPVVYTVFVGRGFEHFQSEDGRIFDWMSHQVRGPIPTKIDVKTVRTTDNQFWWWTFTNFPPKFGITAWPTVAKGTPHPMTLNAVAAKAKGDNILTLTCGAKRHALWLFPEVVSFDKTLTVRYADQQLYRDVPEPNIAASLEDFRLRCDRQRIAWAYVELGSTATRPTVDAAARAALRTQRISQRSR